MTNHRIPTVFGQRHFSNNVRKTFATATVTLAVTSVTSSTAFHHRTTAATALQLYRSFVPPPSNLPSAPSAFLTVSRPYSTPTPICNTMKSSSTPDNNTSTTPLTTHTHDDDTPVATPSTTTNHKSIQILKKNLRRRIRTSLRTLSSTTIHMQSNTVWSKLCAMPEYQSARSIGLFLSMPSGEIDTREICRMVWGGGGSGSVGVGDGGECRKKDLYVPRVGLDFEHPSMELTLVPPPPSPSPTPASFSSAEKKETENKKENDWLPYDDWPRNKWGIPEAPMDPPPVIAKPGDIDLLVVPGLAFDAYGGRLGQGKGYYDRFIKDITTLEEVGEMDWENGRGGGGDCVGDGGGGGGDGTIERLKKRTKKKNVRSDGGDGGDGGDGDGTIEIIKKPLLVAVGLEPSFIDGGERIPMAEYDVGMDRLIVPHKEVMVFR